MQMISVNVSVYFHFISLREVRTINNQIQLTYYYLLNVVV